MKTYIIKNRRAIILSTLILSILIIVALPTTDLSKMKDHIMSNEVYRSIFLAMVFILSFNFIVFAVGKFSSDKKSNTGVTNDSYSKRRARRKRASIEQKIVSYGMHNK